jgi:hypothetical protein
VRWAMLSAPKLPNEALFTVTCLSDRSCVVGGRFASNGRSHVFAAWWSGSGWVSSSVPGPGGSAGSAVLSCASARECFWADPLQIRQATRSHSPCIGTAGAGNWPVSLCLEAPLSLYLETPGVRHWAAFRASPTGPAW